MDKKIMKFGDTEIEKHILKFYQHKNLILIINIDINEIVVSNKVYFCKKGFKYFIGYKYGIKVKPLCIFLLKMSGY